MKARNINEAKYIALNNLYANRICGHNNVCTKNVNFKGINTTKTVQNGLKWVANNFNSAHQRAILGVSALCTQPFIDLHNKHIKKEDKPITVAKTISKIIVGTIAGVTLRHYSIKLIKNFTKNVRVSNYSQCLYPDTILKQLPKNLKNINKETIEFLRNYKNGIGTILGVTTGAFTNFVIDAPLTKLLTNFIHDNFFKKEGSNGR